MLNVSLIKVIIISVLLVLSSLSCKKDNFKFPYAPINANIGIDSDLGDLPLGSAKIFPPERFGGVGGLIIYRDYDDHFFVYDAGCTRDYFDDCRVEISSSFQELLECPCCQSSYLLSSEASVFKGPAIYPLVRYQAFIDGGFLRAVN